MHENACDAIWLTGQSRYSICLLYGQVLHPYSMKKTKQKKESPIEKVSTLTPVLEIVLLLYLSIPHNKPCRLFPLGHEHMHWGTRVRTAIRYLFRVIWRGFLWFLRYKYMSLFGRVVHMPELQVHIIAWRGFRYTQDKGIFLLSPLVCIDICWYCRPILFVLSPLRSQDDSCRAISVRFHSWSMVLIRVHYCRIFFSVLMYIGH